MKLFGTEHLLNSIKKMIIKFMKAEKKFNNFYIFLEA